MYHCVYKQWLIMWSAIYNWVLSIWHICPWAVCETFQGQTDSVQHIYGQHLSIAQLFHGRLSFSLKMKQYIICCCRLLTNNYGKIFYLAVGCECFWSSHGVVVIEIYLHNDLLTVLSIAKIILYRRKPLFISIFTTPSAI